MTKRQNTNTKAFKTKVQSDLVNFFDEGKDGLIDQIKSLLKYDNLNTVCHKLVEGGCFDCYYNHVANRMADWFGCTDSDIWEYYNDDSGKLWQAYINICVTNIKNIYMGYKCYI